MNDDQKAVIQHGAGPLLVIAGPGSGKTYSLVLRAINLLLLGKASSKDLVICTFTEKAAFELRDRIAAAARKVGFKGDLSDLCVDTIHGLCNRLLIQHRHRTPLGNNYGTLDELTQWLFLFDNFNEIIGPADQEVFLNRWKTKWTAIEGASGYFNKITEELVDPSLLQRSGDAFIKSIGQAYIRYQKALFENNKVDFAHLQKILYDLLQEKNVSDAVTNRIKHVLVDEYQDTNYIQEQILLKLCQATSNICVVGDEDQALYRFRGATVRNILEFPQNFPSCPVIKLTTNYRSHKKIVESYDRWMSSWDWANDKGPAFRYNKKIEADKKTVHPGYPAIFSIWGKSQQDEATRFASHVEFLKENNVIHDYNQVALLLRSVKYDYSGPYIEALDKRGIPAFCPRARTYFENDEVRLMIGCFAVILGYFGQGRGEIRGPALEQLAQYVDNCIMELGNRFGMPHPLAKTLQDFVAGISDLKPGKSLDIRPADYFYRLLALEPFATFVKDENSARNLAILSQLLNTFQNYYHYNFVSYKNRDYLKFHLFNSFFRLLYDGGMNEYDDPDRPFPKGYVQILTIHQSKGLEFPVVVAGSLNSLISTTKDVDRNLHPYYRRPPFEPESRITGFDRMRLHYVAFSRAEKILVLTRPEKPKDYFNPIWQGLPQWPYVKKDLLAAQEFEPKERMMIKRSFSFTGDLKLFETCPRQYQFFREYEFTPSRSAVIFFGLLVHQTIEEIHRIVLDGKLRTLDEKRIRELFEKTYSFLALSDVRPIGDPAKETAFEQVMNYFRQNQPEMKRVIETEVDVSVEKDNYILMGKVDLLMGGDGKLEILDFKTSPRPMESDSLIDTYEKQLCIYAHILEKRYGKRPDRLLLYWTSESEKKNAIMEFPYNSNVVHSAGEYFDEVVRKIQGKDFRVITPPERKICGECDMRTFCASDGLIKSEDRDGVRSRVRAWRSCYLSNLNDKISGGPMNLKKAILSVIGRDTLKAIADGLELDEVDRRSVEDLRAGLGRARRAHPKEMLHYLSEAEVKEVCEIYGVDSYGRRKELLKRLRRAAGQRSHVRKSFNDGIRESPMQFQSAVSQDTPDESLRSEDAVLAPLPDSTSGAFQVIRTELVWPGKYTESGDQKDVPVVDLPFQVIERINESRATREAKKTPQPLSLFEVYEGSEGETFDQGWRNKLIWGDNLLVMGSLLKKFAGKVDLIYIDPPFDTGSDFSFRILVGGDDNPLPGKDPSLIEECAYRDTWGQGYNSYLAFMYSRLRLLRELLSDRGSIFVHLDVHTGPYVKILLDEVFGRENFQNEIAWYYYNKLHDSRKKLLPKAFDQILYYVKSKASNYTYNPLKEKREHPVKKLKYRKVGGRIQNIIGEDGKALTYISEERTVDNVWRIRCLQPANKEEWVYFETQKPVDLIERILHLASNPGDLVLDAFAGSGSSLIACERQDRRWIGCDLSRFALHTARKRLLEVEGCKPFEVLNLGKYERQYWQIRTFGRGKNLVEQAFYEYLAFVLKLYGAQPVSGLLHIHGKKGRALTHIGAIDSPVTIDEINSALDECIQVKQSELHILGWEWEMGIYDLMIAEAKKKGIKLLLLQIPREVMEQRSTVEGNDIQFFELAYLEVEITSKKPGVLTVSLRNFVIPNVELIPEDVRAKIKKWSDYIDYWAVDWDFQNDTFMQGWVTYRTRKDRTLALTSDPHTYEKPGKYKIVVKVIDIFGNDTSQAFDFEVK